jgi:hypothetical protein
MRRSLFNAVHNMTDEGSNLGFSLIVSNITKSDILSYKISVEVTTVACTINIFL